MTSAGSINLGVDIDAGDLRGELTRAVREAMGPVLADLQRDLRGVQDEYKDTARAADKSAVQQSAAAEKTERAIHGISNEQKKLAAQATATGLVSVRSLNNQTKAIDKQALAWDRLAAAKARAAAVPNPDPARGPPVGRGGGSGGGRGGGGGGAMGFVTSPLGLNALASGAALLPGVLTGASTAVVNLVGAIQALGQAGLVLPGVFASIGASFGTAVVGFHGMTDAVSALWEAAASGDPKDILKATEALKDMAPAAVEVAKAVAGTRDSVIDLQKTVAQNMFEGVAADFDNFSGKVLPRAKTGMTEVAKAWNGTLKELLRVGGSDSSLSFLDRIFGNTAEGQKRANAAIEPLVHAFGSLAATGSDFIPRLADGLEKLATRFDNFITKADQTGQLAKWIDEGFKAASNLGTSLLNVGKIITDLTKAAGGDGGFLKWLADATTRLHDFLSSDEGQAKLTAFFKEGKEELAKWMPVLKDVAKLALAVFDGFKQWGQVMLPVISQVLDLLNSMPGSVTAVVTAFLAWRTISGITSLLGGIGKVEGALGGLPGKATGAVGGINKAFAALAIGSATLGLSSGMNEPDDSAASKLGGLGINVAGGAITGAMVGGPWGAAIGAMIGAGVTLFQSAKAQLDQGKKEWEDAWQRDHDAGPDREGSPERQQAAVPAIRGAMRPDLFNPDGSPKPTGAQSFSDFIAKNPQLGKVMPDGTVVGPDGSVLPGITVPQPGTAPSQFYPGTNIPLQGPGGAPLPPRPIPPPVQFDGGSPFPVAPPVPAPKTNVPGFPLQTVQPAPALPPNTSPLLIGPQLAALPQATQQVQQLASEVQNLPTGEVKIKDPTPELKDNLTKLGVQITDVGKNEIVVKATTDEAKATLDAFVRDYQSKKFQLQFQAAITPPGAAPAPRAGGGVFPGYSPGHDSILAYVSPGEGVLIPEAVRGIGGAAGVYALNSAFRGGLSRQHYAGGGVIPGFADGAGDIVPGAAADPNSVAGLLMQIRDLLAGKSGTGPLVDTAKGVAGLAQDAKTGGTGAKTGPFGTPLKPRNAAYDAAAAAISALGGDPEKFIGMDPATLSTAQGGMLPTATAIGTAGGGQVSIAALQKFATTGNVADLPPGLTVNSPVVTAITGARNKKTGLGDQAISDLIGQGLGPGGFTGTLDTNNTALVKALEKLRTKGLPATAGGTGLAASGLTGGLPGGLGLPGAMDPISAFAAANTGGQYQWGASDLAKGLSDCTGAISDLVELATKGQADSGRLFDTSNAASVLQSLGATPGLVPGQLQIGFNSGHAAATLPNGVNFESGGGTGQGATYGGNAIGAGDPRFTQQFSLATPGSIPGLASGATGAGTGTPVFVTNWPGGGAGAEFGKQLLGAGLGAAGQAGAGVAGDIVSGVAGATDTNIGNGVPNATLAQLVKEGNPLALLQAAGFNVPDFTKQGGGGEDFAKPDAPYDASGRLFSDTSALSNRTDTSLAAQIEDMKKQLTAVLDEVKDKLSEQALKPIIEGAIQSGMEGLKDSVSAAIGTSLGTAAAPPIADAVSSAVSSIQTAGGGSVGTDAANVVTGVVGGQAMAAGGPVFGGQPGVDSVPAMLMPDEHVFTRDDVRAMGGHQNVYAFRRALRNGGIKGMATGGGVNVNDTVGAEFFGVSEVPIIGAIVNLLIKVLLKVLGVNIEARDTLNEMTDDFRNFRGDFKAFDASGRLMNDTSALVDRSSTSEQEAAQERIRILKIVIEALIKYIIEKVIVPIAKAVANAAISAGGAAAGAGVNSVAPGAGGIVSSLITSGGSAGVDILADVGSDFAVAIAGTLVDALGDAIISQGGDLATSLFGGGAIEQLLIGPLTGSITDPILAAFGGLTGAISTLFGGLLGAASFDDGGIATGTGMMPKATIAPERVLNPVQTQLFDRMVAAMERGGTGGSSSQTVVHAPITVTGGPEAGANVRDRLLELID